MRRSKRTYRSPTRKRQAEDTRRSIVAAARKLFVKNGWASTTMEQIAEEAEVSVPTVYSIFASKQGILAALLEQASFGQSYQALVDQELQEVEPDQRLKVASRIARTIYTAEGKELEFLRGAGVVSPELALKEREREGRRFEAQKHVIEYIRSSGRLRKGLTKKRARDIFWALTSRDLFRLLVSEQGWTPNDYETWLSGILISQLIETR